MNEDKKIVVNVESDKGIANVQIGNDIIKLNEETFRIFRTDNITALCDFFKGDEDLKKMVALYNERQVKVYEGEFKGRSKAEAVGVCEMSDSQALNYLGGNTGRSMSIDQFEMFLAYLMPYADGNVALDLLSRVKNFSLEKVTSVKRQKDNAGNFNYHVQRKAGNEDFIPPEKLQWSIPIFKHIEEVVTFEFDFVFSFSEADGETDLRFKLQNPEFQEQLQSAQKEQIEKLVEFFPKKYWGSFKVERADDSWKYKENAVR